MTEEEAKTKWCPFARQMVTLDRSSSGAKLMEPFAVGAANRFDGDRFSTCMGSGCMAWRWQRKSEISTVTPEGDGWHLRVVPQSRGGVTVWERQVAPTDGYCGIAGKPGP